MVVADVAATTVEEVVDVTVVVVTPRGIDRTKGCCRYRCRIVQNEGMKGLLTSKSLERKKILKWC